MNRKVKIIDIAQKSGVSPATVSLILNNKPGISAETRARVLEIASELGYPLHQAAKIDASPSLTTIAMMVKIDPDIPPSANPFYSKVIVGIEDACRRKGINLLFSSLPVDENNVPREAPALLSNGSVDGVLMVGVNLNSQSADATGKNLPPIVLVDGYSETNVFDTVISDNFQASYQAVEHLIQQGHRHIGLAGSQECCFPSLNDRRNGYLRALKENHITSHYIANFNINKSKGYEEVIHLLKENPQITALFCVNDDIANAAIRSAQSLGKRVPEDLSIIGYDDTYIAANSHPTLTTMHVDTVAMGRAAVKLLSFRVENPDSARTTLVIHAQLVERESVAAVRSN